MKAKDQWVEKTLESLDNLSQPEANSYLFEKIMNRMQNRKNAGLLLSKKVIWKLSLGFAILLILNIASIKKYHSQQAGNNHGFSTSGNEYSFDFNYYY